MRRFRAIFKKEFRQIRRDPLSLGLLIFIPALLLVLYGYALSFDVKHIRVAVLDLDRTPRSREFQDGLFQNPYFDRAESLDRLEQADEILARGRARAVLVIPRGYSSGIERGADVKVQVLIDGADANTAGTTVGYFDAMADRVTQQVRREALARRGLSPPLPIVVPEPRIWFNPELESAHFLIPGLIGMLLMLAAVVATALSIVREKEHETMEQIMASPVRSHELIAGKTLPYVAVCLVTMVMILVLGRVLFGVIVRGSFLVLGGTTLVFLFAALGMGVLISSATNSQQMAFQISILTSLLPSLLLSGLIFPIQNMPLPVQGLTFLVIPRYFVAALRGIILKGASWGVIWPQLLGMLVLGCLFNLLAIRNIRKSV